MKIHMVKKGDSLYEIAQKHHIELDKLIAANPHISDPNVLEVGVKVKIPNAPKPVAPPSDYLYKHTVVQGDSLWKLGKAWGISLADMIAANPQLKNPNVLMTGEVVYIPKSKPAKATEQPKPSAVPEAVMEDANFHVSPPDAEQPELTGAPAAPPITAMPQPPAMLLTPEIAPELPGVPAAGQSPAPALPHLEQPVPLQPLPELPNFPQVPAPQMPDFPGVSYPGAGHQVPADVPWSGMGHSPQAVHPFEQFQVPATEAASYNIELNAAQHNIWLEPKLPAYPHFPAAEQLPYFEHHTPFEPNPPSAGAAGDCGCGGFAAHEHPWGVGGHGYPGFPQLQPEHHAHGPQGYTPYFHGMIEPAHTGFGPFDAFGAHAHGAEAYAHGPEAYAHGPEAYAHEQYSKPYGYPYAPLEPWGLHDEDDCDRTEPKAEAPRKSAPKQRANVSQSEPAAVKKADAVKPKAPARREDPVKAAIRSLIEREGRKAARSAAKRSGSRPWMN